MNNCCFVGTIVAEPDLRYTKNGKAVCNFRMAVSSYKGDDDFFNFTAWNKLAENVAKYLEKGQRAAVEGRLNISKSEKGNKTYYNTTIIARNVTFLGKSRKSKSNDTEDNEENIKEDDYEVPY